jgi:drug/metabolite transporter (DMT)-like permease
MNNRLIGIVLIVAGAALVAWGYNIYDSAGSQVSRALTGDTPIKAWAGMVGGAVSIIIGILKVK